MQIIFAMKGSLAEENKVPAFASLESLHAFSQAIMICSYYIKTGEVRRRRFKELDIDFRLSETRPGSFEVVFDLSQFAPYFVEAYGKGAAQASWAFIQSVFSRAVGAKDNSAINELEASGDIPSGDLGAVVQAAEPSIRRSHAIVNHGANSVNIFVQGNENNIVLDGASKEYMHEDIFNNDIRSQRFMVTSYDGRNRTGRVFDIDEEQGYTFELDTNADRQSLVSIADASRAYALREKGRFDERTEVVCVYTSVDAPDGRKKRLKVFGAATEYDQLDFERIEQITAPRFATLQRSRRLLLSDEDDDDDGSGDVLE
ncbi:hypothetical protein [Roseivivax marinus]|uniref:DUF7946 domain-containing protein n=1 Tax=Roseivivax marinus TaxID=1379903 RepID=UPI00103A7791|nr:hypothetical protein [Roseivivax marinus]